MGHWSTDLLRATRMWSASERAATGTGSSVLSHQCPRYLYLQTCRALRRVRIHELNACRYYDKFRSLSKSAGRQEVSESYQTAYVRSYAAMEEIQSLGNFSI